MEPEKDQDLDFSNGGTVQEGSPDSRALAENADRESLNNRPPSNPLPNQEEHDHPDIDQVTDMPSDHPSPDPD